jgi:hypothetical protein
VNVLSEKDTAAICLDNILFATDFSPVSEAVLPYVKAIAAATTARCRQCT